MKVLIVKDYDLKDFSSFEEIIKESGFEVSEIVSSSSCVDSVIEQYVEKYKTSIKYFYNNPKQIGESFGPIKSKEMVDYCDVVIAICKNDTNIKHIVEEAYKLDKQLYMVSGNI